MPGSPATSPRFGAPRYADSDTASFSSQVNSVTDTFDALAARTDDARFTDQRTPADNSVTTAKLADGSVTKAKLNDQTAIFAPGDLIFNAGTAARAGALACDGSAVSRTTYAALFAAIGTAWGSGDGSTTFNLPDFRGRSPMGSGVGAGLTGRTVGQKLGEELHALTGAETGPHTHTITDPSHSHALSDPGHTHGGSIGQTDFLGGWQVPTTGNTPIGNTQSGVQSGGSWLAIPAAGIWTGHNTLHGHTLTVNSATTGIGVNGATTGITVNSAGSGSGHNVIHPVAVCAIYIKT